MLVIVTDLIEPKVEWKLSVKFTRPEIELIKSGYRYAIDCQVGDQHENFNEVTAGQSRLIQNLLAENEKLKADYKKLLMGEFICNRCGIRKPDDYPKPDF